MKVKEIEGLIDFIAQTGLEEVNVETDQIKLSIKRNATTPSITVPDTLVLPQAPTTSHVPKPDHYVEIKAPMIGTFYRAANPESPPFVQVGDTVQKGDTLCIIEAMKLFNEIEADTTGTIVKILVDDASPVEYDQPLFQIAPE